MSNFCNQKSLPIFQTFLLYSFFINSSFSIDKFLKIAKMGHSRRVEWVQKLLIRGGKVMKPRAWILAEGEDGKLHLFNSGRVWRIGVDRKVGIQEDWIASVLVPEDVCERLLAVAEYLDEAYRQGQFVDDLETLLTFACQFDRAAVRRK